MEIQRVSLKDYVSAWNLGGLAVTQMALKTAIELNIFNIIANSGPGAHLTSKEIVSQISNTNPSAAAANLKRIYTKSSQCSFSAICISKVKLKW
ncbi:hypothetical protein ABKV19_003916 [Rosa sericea]